MTQKNLILIVATAILLSSAFLIGCTNAVDGDPLRLPSSGTVIILEASNSTQAYFDSTLRDVPDGYDVTNATYLGWCIDRSAEMTRLTPHTINLYSSFSPTGELASENWTMVNYVLNHKQGEVQDVQEAIWYFIDMNGTYTPKSSVAFAIIDDAETNGNEFVPAEGQIAAVIAYPVYVTDPTPVQISIFEVTVSSNGSGQNNPDDGSEGSSGIVNNDVFLAIAVVVALVAVVIGALLIIRRRRK
jgi:hypothetical protein